MLLVRLESFDFLSIYFFHLEREVLSFISSVFNCFVLFLIYVYYILHFTWNLVTN